MGFFANLGAKVKAFFTKIGDKVEAAINKVGLELVNEWRQFYSMYSVWFFAVIGGAPDLYNLALSSGLLTGSTAPPELARIINVIAFLGAASRLVKQKKLEAASEAEANKAKE